MKTYKGGLNMKDTTASKDSVVSDIEFWHNLQVDMYNSNQGIQIKDTTSLVEQSFMFSMFFRNSSNAELLGYHKFLKLMDYGYLLLIDISEFLTSSTHKSKIDSSTLYLLIKKALKNINNSIGPLIGNRISILVTHNSINEDDSVNVANLLVNMFNEKQITVTIGIGSITSIHSIYTSFLESLTALSYCNSNDYMHFDDTRGFRKETSFDYEDTEKHFLDAVKQRKVEAYDYFGILMELIAPFNDLAKRNYIVEILFLSAHVMRSDNPDIMKKFNPLGKAKELMECKGSELIDWAFKQFIYITGIVKTQNSIDYSNKIVRLTRKYLEVHYTEDISLEDVASQANVSPQYFSKLIKKNTGFNFIDWLSMMRVKKAKELFNTTNLSIKEVCYMIGYKDPNYFSRIFKKRVGMTPSEYIKNSNLRISDK